MGFSVWGLRVFLDFIVENQFGAGVAGLGGCEVFPEFVDGRGFGLGGSGSRAIVCWPGTVGSMVSDWRRVWRMRACASSGLRL